MNALWDANIRRALEACGGRVSGRDGAAALLGIPPTTLASRLRRMGLDGSR
jgi:transcriptional regulator of acetoin/glycerol metabolism